ncbi:MAG: DUF134 domain-containing protein [Candidatus Thorarchaeota archaeon]
MGRRTRMRYVKNPPNNFYFDTAPGTPVSNEFIILTLAEFEAMRLRHYVPLRTTDKFKQTKAAETLGVSQPTFSRILDSAHKKITRALIEGKQIRISGGNIDYKEFFVGYGCLNCNEEWEVPTASKDKKVNCPKCNSDKTYYLVKEPL